MRFQSPCCRQPISVKGQQELDQLICPICRRAFAASEEERTVGDYYLLQRVGSGGFGVVFKSRHLETSELYAVKVSKDPANGEFANLAMEARLAQQLDHPNIVGIHDIGNQDGTLFVASRFISGGDLSSRLKAGEKFSFEQIATLCRTTAEALAFAHEAGLVHRDLKPSNIIIDENSTPFVIDFGLSKRDDDAHSSTIERYREARFLLSRDSQSKSNRAGPLIGTIVYMSPEQASGMGRNAGPASDIYTLGVILYELITGRLPFYRATKEKTIEDIIMKSPRLPRRVKWGVPEVLESICMKAMSKEITDRYESAESMAAALKEAEEALRNGTARLTRSVFSWFKT